MVNGTTDFSLQYGGISKVMKTNRPVVNMQKKNDHHRRNEAPTQADMNAAMFENAVDVLHGLT